MSEHNHDHNPKQQTQGAIPHERLHVNGAGDGPVSGGGKGAGNKSPPGNGKAPPGGGGEGSLRDRVTTLEANMATKSDLHKVETRLREDIGKDISKAIKASEKRTRLAMREDMRKEMRGWAREFRLWAGLFLAALLAASSLPPLWSFLGSLL